MCIYTVYPYNRCMYPLCVCAFVIVLTPRTSECIDIVRTNAHHGTRGVLISSLSRFLPPIHILPFPPQMRRTINHIPYSIVAAAFGRTLSSPAKNYNSISLLQGVGGVLSTYDDEDIWYTIYDIRYSIYDLIYMIYDLIYYLLSKYILFQCGVARTRMLYNTEPGNVSFTMSTGDTVTPCLPLTP